MSHTGEKRPNIWALASVTYGAVIAVAIISVAAYYYLAPKRNTSQQLTDAERSMAVGSVWLPIYPRAMVSSTTSTKQDSITNSILTFESSDPADRVLAFYQVALKKGVFRFSTVTKNPGGGVVRSLAHDGKTSVTVTIRTEGAGSRGEMHTIDRDSSDKDTRK